AHEWFDEVIEARVVGAHGKVSRRAEMLDTELQRVAGLRLQVRVRDGGVAEGEVGESDVDGTVARRAKAVRVLCEQAGGIRQLVEGAEPWRPVRVGHVLGRAPGTGVVKD